MANLFADNPEEEKKKKVRAVLAKMRADQLPDEMLQPEQQPGVINQVRGDGEDNGEMDFSSIEQDNELTPDEEEMKRQLAKKLERLFAGRGGKLPK